MNKLKFPYLKLAVVTFYVGMFTVVLPWLISAESTIAVISGMALAALPGLKAIYYSAQKINEYLNQNQ